MPSAAVCKGHWLLVQAELDKAVQRERALAEAEGRIRENRENEDINRRALLVRLEEERKKVVEAITVTFGCDVLPLSADLLWADLKLGCQHNFCLLAQDTAFPPYSKHTCFKE